METITTEKPDNLFDYVRDELLPGEGRKVLKAALVGTTVYAVVELENHVEKRNELQVITCLVYVDRHNAYTPKGTTIVKFTIESEDENPDKAECPLTLMDLCHPEELTLAARTWRERCREYRSKRSAGMKLANAVRKKTRLKDKDYQAIVEAGFSVPKAQLPVGR